MITLGIETSCDDTAVALVRNGTEVLASVRIGQKDHASWGGVVPEIAARLHEKNMINALKKCLTDAKISTEKIDLIAVTQGPGLQTSLLIGTTMGSFLSLLWQKKIIAINHIFGHALSIFLDRHLEEIQYPALVLTASGGHTALRLAKNLSQSQMLGHTIDDACGEAFDKLAILLDLGYPGGPVVGEKAKKGDRNAIKFPRVYLAPDSLDFSFSGIKAFVQRLISEEKKYKLLSEKFIADVCASFEQTVFYIFRKKLERAVKKFPEIKQIHFVGGVSANIFLRENLSVWSEENGLKLLTPKKIEYNTDNAAMIAAAGFFEHQNNPNLAEKKFIEANCAMDRW